MNAIVAQKTRESIKLTKEMFAEEKPQFEELINKKGENGQILRVKKQDIISNEPIIFEDCFLK
jgi:hypothetical protein